MFDKIEKERKEMTPKKGFNCVGVDKFEVPGEALYLVSHHGSRAEALSAAKKMKRENPADDFYVYGPDGEVGG